MLYFHCVDGNCKNYPRTVLPSVWKESELPAKTVVLLYSIFWKFRIPLHPTFLLLLLALPGLRQLLASHCQAQVFSHASPCGLSDWQHVASTGLSGYWFSTVTVILPVILHLSIPSGT